MDRDKWPLAMFVERKGYPSKCHDTSKQITSLESHINVTFVAKYPGQGIRYGNINFQPIRITKVLMQD